jgi:MoxR-like ATPase
VTAIPSLQQRFGIVGRERELTLGLAVLAAGRHLLLEGPVGVGKTTVASALCGHLDRRFLRVDGDERYTENKLAGWFDPPLVMKSGYGEESFFPGPLVRAMREGAVLFLNELNRMPESVQNVLLPALDEHLLILPRIGEVRAREGFQVIATQNPVEYVATGHLSEALRDRFEHVPLDYQNEEEEMAIVRRETSSGDGELVRTAVALVRETRRHPKLRKGASVRAAIALTAIAGRLDGGRDALLEAALAALTTRVELKDEEEADLRSIVREILEGIKKNEKAR